MKNITKGEWIAERDAEGQLWIFSTEERETEALVKIEQGELEDGSIIQSYEYDANAQLIADAGTTANKCGLLPSELLEQRDMLLKSLRECVRLLEEENEPVYHGFDEEVNRAKEAIQKCQ